MQVVGHDHEGAESIVPQVGPAQESREDQLGHGLLAQELRPVLAAVQIAVDPHEHPPGGDLGGRRRLGRRKAAVQMPSEEQPAVWRIAVGKPAMRLQMKMWGSSERILASTRVSTRHTKACALQNPHAPSPQVNAYSASPHADSGGELQTQDSPDRRFSHTTPRPSGPIGTFGK